MESESESAANKVVQNKSAEYEGNYSEEKLGEPDDKDGFDGDIESSLTANVFKYVVPMALNDVVWRDTVLRNSTMENEIK